MGISKPHYIVYLVRAPPYRTYGDVNVCVCVCVCEDIVTFT